MARFLLTRSAGTRSGQSLFLPTAIWHPRPEESQAWLPCFPGRCHRLGYSDRNWTLSTAAPLILRGTRRTFPFAGMRACYADWIISQ